VRLSLAGANYWLWLLTIWLIGCVEVATPSSVSISYTPEKTVQPVKGAGTVSVTVNDLRADQNKVGNEMGAVTKAGDRPILANENVEVVVRSAIETELRDRGFTIGRGTATVAIDISEFNVQRVVEVSNVLLMVRSYHSHADVLMHVAVIGGKRGSLYAKLIFGQSSSRDSADQENLDNALHKALQDLFADQRFTNAILAAERSH
jgi:uncharacterized lipoprotein YajG